MELIDMPIFVVKIDAYDFFTTVGAPPSPKKNGEILPVKLKQVNYVKAYQAINAMMKLRRKREFQISRECNCSATQ